MTERMLPGEPPEGCRLILRERQVPPMHRAPREHRHSFFEVAQFLSGHGSYDTEAGRLPICPGDIFVFSSNEYHCITDIEEGEPFTFRLLQVSPAWFAENAGTGPDYSLLFQHAPGFCSRIPPGGEPARRLAGCIRQIEAECTARAFGYEELVRGELVRLLITLVRHFGYSGSSPLPADPHARLTGEVLAYIDRHFCEDISVADITAGRNISPNHLSCLFKKSLGLTVWEYVLKKRIEKACMELDSRPECNILDIAVSCGFNNTANFNKLFKKRMGLTPREYRSGREPRDI